MSSLGWFPTEILATTAHQTMTIDCAAAFAASQQACPRATFGPMANSNLCSCEAPQCVHTSDQSVGQSITPFLAPYADQSLNVRVSTHHHIHRFHRECWIQSQHVRSSCHKKCAHAMTMVETQTTLGIFLSNRLKMWALKNNVFFTTHGASTTKPANPTMTGNTCMHGCASSSRSVISALCHPRSSAQTPGPR